MAQVDSVIHTLERVDVVATRHTDAVRASTPVQQIDRDRMLRFGIHTMTDALRHMAGITVRDYGGAGGMKTVSVRGIGARHTAVVYDGIALSDCQTGEIDLSRFSLDQLASLRLVIGNDDNIFQPARNQAAAATLYLETHTLLSPLPLPTREGSRMLDSLNSLRVITPLPTREGQGGESSFTIGSFGLVHPSIHLTSRNSEPGEEPLNDRRSLNSMNIESRGGGKLFSSLFIDFFHADNDYPFTLHNVTLTTLEHRTNSHMNAGRGELNLDWQPTGHTTLSAKAYYHNNHRRLPGIVHYYTSENHERLAEQTAFGQLRLHSQLSDQWALLVNAKYNWSHTDYQNRTPGSGLGDARYWQREAYASASLLFAPLSWLSFDYAVDLQHNALNSTIAVYASHPHRITLLQAVAAKAQWSRLTLVARTLYHYSYTSSKSNTPPYGGGDRGEASPSLSLSYRLLPHDQFYLRLMAKRIFRLPTFNELYYYHIGSADLRPEKATQLNLGLTWQSSFPSWEGLGVGITLDAYVNRVTDKIVAVPYNMFVWRIMNIGETTICGLDITANAACHLNPRHTLALSGNYSCQRAMNTTSRTSSSYRNQLPYTPLHTCCATLSWENPWANIATTFSGQTERWTTIEHSVGTRISPFTTTDLSLWRTFSFRSHRHTSLPTGALDPQGHFHSGSVERTGRGGAFTLRFTFQNIFNRQYDIVAHYPMPGRSWRLQLAVPL